MSIPSPNEEEKGREGALSQSSIADDDDNDESFSAPASPSLSRENKITTLQERSRLFSHGSAEDLPSRVIQDGSGKGERRRHKRRESIGYVILASASSSIDQNESSPDQLIQIDDFQFRERVPSPRSPSLPPNDTKPPNTTVTPIISQIPTSTSSPTSFSPIFSPSFSTTFSYNEATGGIPEKTLPPSLSPVEAITLSAPVYVTDSEPLEEHTAPSTAASTGGTGKRFSRWKAKLFKRSQQQEQRYEEEEELEEKQSDSRFYVDSVEEEKDEVVGGRGRLARSILRGIKTSSSSLTREKADNVEVIDEEKQLMISAMAASRTRFIII